MGGLAGESWKALYDDSSEDEATTVRSAPTSRDLVAQLRPPSRNTSKRPRCSGSPAQSAVVEDAIGSEHQRGCSSSSSSSRITHASLDTESVGKLLRGSAFSKPAMQATPSSPAVSSRCPPRSSMGGALGLLEPDSSDSDDASRRNIAKFPASIEPARMGSAQTQKQTRPRNSTCGAETGEIDDDPIEDGSPPGQTPSAPPVSLEVPPPPPPFDLGQRREIDGLLAAFPGPDTGFASRWSEGPLTLPNGIELPECIASCLRPYQRDGVSWLYERLFVENRGCLLTDEMGLGKTVQVACCLAVGLYGQPSVANVGESPGPVLVICPPSLVQNWARELRRWGPFSVEILAASGGPAGGRIRAMQRLDAGIADVLVASRGLLKEGEGAHIDGLCARRWGCVVIDEIHQAKNPKGLLHRALVNLRCPRKLGLTGTPLQNSLTDMWSLLRIAGAHEGWDLAAFESRFGRPIARGQKRKASVKDLAVREDALKEFRELLSRQCLRRTKDSVALMLPGKNDRIVPCPLSPVQRAAYANLLASPDWQMALGKRQVCICGAGKPCLCGVGPVWRYIHQRQAEQKGLEDECAAADDCVCRGRSPPKCLSLSLIVLLQRITNHVELLKPDPQPPKDSYEQAQQELMAQLCDIAFAGIDHNLCTHRRVANRLQLGSPEACGKMQMLIPLLRHWRKRGQKVLLFSKSTRLLDILESCLWQQGLSPEVLRLDGGTPPSHRQKLVDEFNNSPTRGVFLISTRAGGVGLNLTSASVVVIFDPDWNPFCDLQAQDRSFRIGQTRVVEVYRLLSAGSIEEQVYIRQVWKQQLASTSIDGTRGARRLDDSTFGLETLFELHESSMLPALMAEACTTRSHPQEISEAGVSVYCDMRGGGNLGMQVSDLLQAHSPEKDDDGEDNGGADSDAGSEGAAHALEQLHGMFDQVDHAKVVRNDTQENIMLMDLPED